MSENRVWIGCTDHDRLGPIWVAISVRGLVAVEMRGSERRVRQALASQHVVVDAEQVSDALAQVSDYLAGRGRSFDLPIDWTVLSPFQAQVLQIVHAIPYGATRTYQEIAAELGKPGGARAVGRANATNPMPLVIPCHRVLGQNGRLHGYGGPGGVETKAWLLRLEGSRLL